MREPDTSPESPPSELVARRLEDDLAIAEAAMAHVEAGELDAADQALARLRSGPTGDDGDADRSAGSGRGPGDRAVEVAEVTTLPASP